MVTPGNKAQGGNMSFSFLLFLFLILLLVGVVGTAFLIYCGGSSEQSKQQDETFKEFTVSNAATTKEDFFVAFPSLRRYRHKPEYDNLEFCLCDLSKVSPFISLNGISPRDAKGLVEQKGFRNATPEEFVYYVKKQALLGEKGESFGSSVVALGKYANRTTDYHDTGILNYSCFYPGRCFIQNWGCSMNFILYGGFSVDNTFFLGVREKKSKEGSCS